MGWASVLVGSLLLTRSGSVEDLCFTTSFSSALVFVAVVVCSRAVFAANSAASCVRRCNFGDSRSASVRASFSTTVGSETFSTGFSSVGSSLFFYPFPAEPLVEIWVQN